MRSRGTLRFVLRSKNTRSLDYAARRKTRRASSLEMTLLR
jgi:hypothetical protein